MWCCRQDWWQSCCLGFKLRNDVGKFGCVFSYFLRSKADVKFCKMPTSTEQLRKQYADKQQSSYRHYWLRSFEHFLWLWQGLSTRTLRLHRVKVGQSRRSDSVDGRVNGIQNSSGDYSLYRVKRNWETNFHEPQFALRKPRICYRSCGIFNSIYKFLLDFVLPGPGKTKAKSTEALGNDTRITNRGGLLEWKSLDWTRYVAGWIKYGNW